MSTTTREGDTLHIDLLDYIKGYDPEIKVSKYMIEKFLKDFDISEEGLTIITGNQSDWITFLCMIVEHYKF